MYMRLIPHKNLLLPMLRTFFCITGLMSVTHSQTFASTTMTSPSAHSEKRLDERRVQVNHSLGERILIKKSLPNINMESISNRPHNDIPTHDCLPSLPTRYQRIYANGKVYYFAAQHYYVRYGLSYCRVILQL